MSCYQDRITEAVVRFQNGMLGHLKEMYLLQWVAYKYNIGWKTNH